MTRTEKAAIVSIVVVAIVFALVFGLVDAAHPAGLGWCRRC